MPRYCAVKVCRNRGGAAARQDNKRISFYPFPLQDKPRLQKWVDNMRREEWTPSRHQYLCSEHFTEDSFDIRWGIRYLRNTAVPTIFPAAEDDCENVTTIGESPKSIPIPSVTEASGSDSPLSKRPLILSRTCKELQSCESGDAVGRHTELMEAVRLFEVPSVPDAAAVISLSDLCDVQCLGDGGEAAPSEEQSASSVAVLCCHSLDTVMDGEVEAAVALQSALNFVPLGVVRDQPAGALWADGDAAEEEHASLCEHSYCRPDTDKDHLWSKILALHAKILELDRREASTVAKIQGLEAEIALLKKDGAVFKEKQKVLEDYISSLLL